MSPKNGNVSWSGYTLIELLIVLGIIGVLASLLVPVFARAREQGRVADCTNNLQQLYTAFALYASDHDNFVPPYLDRFGHSFGHPLVAVPEHGALLIAALQPYTKSTAIWFCPSDYFARTNSVEGFIRHSYTSYATFDYMGSLPLTLDGTFGNPFPPFSMETSELPSAPPDRIPLLRDNLWSGEELSYSPNNPLPYKYSHNGAFNYLFLDGHVKTYPWMAAPIAFAPP